MLGWTSEGLIQPSCVNFGIPEWGRRIYGSDQQQLYGVITLMEYLRKMERCFSQAWLDANKDNNTLCSQPLDSYAAARTLVRRIPLPDLLATAVTAWRLSSKYFGELILIVLGLWSFVDGKHNAQTLFDWLVGCIYGRKVGWERHPVRGCHLHPLIWFAVFLLYCACLGWGWGLKQY